MLAQACAYNAHRLVRRKHELGLDPLPTSPASRARRRARLAGAGVGYASPLEARDMWASAARGSRAGVAKGLAGNSVDSPSRGFPHETALHAAVTAGGALRVVKHLLEKGARPDSLDSLDNTPLHRACRWGRLDEAKLLLKPRQDSAERDCAILWATKRNADGLNPLQVATKYGHTELVNLIHGL